MKRFLRNLLVPPVFESEDKTILAKRLYYVLQAIIVISALFAIPFVLFPVALASRFATVVAVVLPFCILLLELTRRGWTRLVSYTLMLGLWVIVTCSALATGGIQTHSFMGYLVIIVIASLLLDRYAMIALSGMSLLTGFALAFAETHHLLPIPVVTYTPYANSVMFAFFVLALLAFQHVSWGAMQMTLEDLRNELNRRKQVEKKLEQRADEMFLLYQMGKALTSGGNLYEALRAMAQNLKRLMTVDALYIGLYDEPTRMVFFPLFYVDREREAEVSPVNIDERPGLTAHIIHTRQTLYLPDVQSPETQKNYQVVIIDTLDVHSYLGIPLINEGRVLGVMSVQARETHAYTDEQVRLLETLASQVAIVVESHRLLERLQKELAERKLTETALRESEARLWAIINQFPYDLWVCDAQGRYIMKNRTSEEVYPNAIGKTAAEMLETPPEIRQRWVEENNRALRGEVVHSGPNTEMVNGEWRSFMTTVVPIVVDDQIIGITGLGFEVTELRRAEEEVRKLNDELERQVAHRTAALEQANQELQAFSYSISHDLRAPLRSIRGFAQILKNDFSERLDAEGGETLDKVIYAAEEMGALINSLLTLFRIGQGELRRIRLDLSAEARAVIEALHHSEPDREVAWRVAEGLFATADASLMRNVLENLLGNAWKYSAQNPQAVIEFGAESQAGETVYFVRDNGSGFNMKYADKLFQPFQRLHRASEFPGHGIGLATVQRIIQRHGGRIWAAAEVNKGATFYFTLEALDSS